MKKTELLAPAGDMSKLKTALLYGADAVYLGGKRFGLRSYSGNFSPEEMKEAIDFAHSSGKKVYVTVNIFAHNDDLSGLPQYLEEISAFKADAIIVSDPGVFSIARECVPDLPLHVSTQANTVNWQAVEFWRKIGAERVVLARELSEKEIATIREKSPIELEMFIHGAMCMSYSGRCVMSNYMTGRDSNRGACAQACRWKYSLVEEKRPHEYFPIEEDENGAYIFNSKDLCLLPYLGHILDMGIDSLKIEGRMKSVYYVAGVVKTYREAIDAYYEDKEKFAANLPKWQADLEKVSHRPYTAGFFNGSLTASDHVYETASYAQDAEFVGVVLSYDAEGGFAHVEQRNNLKCGQTIEFFQPRQVSFEQKIEQMYDDATGEAILVAPHPQQRIRIKVDKPVEEHTLLRRAKHK